jgi:hypothetical protein
MIFDDTKLVIKRHPDNIKEAFLLNLIALGRSTCLQIHYKTIIIYQKI